VHYSCKLIQTHISETKLVTCILADSWFEPHTDPLPRNPLCCPLCNPSF